MLEGFSHLTYVDVIYAALTAFVITQVVLSLKRVKINVVKIRGNHENVSDAERKAIIKECMNMFPVKTVNFRGKVFTTGMFVRITTFQKRIIEGEFIGKNDKDVLCVITGEHIIAHEMNKIEDITEINEKTVN